MLSSNSQEVCTTKEASLGNGKMADKLPVIMDNRNESIVTEADLKIL